MKIETRQNDVFFELTVISGDIKITEDIEVRNGFKPGYIVPDESIENFISIANDMSRFNGTPDIEFVKTIIGAFLNDSERAELIDYLTES